MKMFLGVLLIGLGALCGCVETPVNPVVDDRLSPKLRLTQGTSFDVDVTTDITTFTPDGKVRKKYKHKATVEATVVDGIAYGKVKRTTLSDAAFRGMATPEEVPDSINLTPVLGLADGELSDYYNDTVHDNNGNYVLITGSGAEEGQPVSHVTAYHEGQLIGTTEMNWSAVSGGYLLNTQTLTERSGSSVLAIMESTVDESTIQIVQGPTAISRFAASLKSTAKAVGCALLPPAAQAMVVGCFWEGVDLAAATVGIGFASAATGIVTPGAIAVYLMGWAGWTRALYVFLKCMSRRT